MRHFKHPATVIALIALFAALSGGAGAAMTKLISGSQIKKGSIPENRLKPSAIKDLQVIGMATTTGNGGNACPENTTSNYTFCGVPYAVTLVKKTGVLVICYAQHGSSTLTEVSRVFPDFVAPANSYIAQATTAVVGGLTGQYDVGLCVKNQSANAQNGNYTVSALAAKTNKGVTKLIP
jgi:hypothetical protein